MRENILLNLPGFNYHGKRVIVDTGSATSFGKIDNIKILNKNIPLNDINQLPELNEILTDNIVALVGYDIIEHFDFILRPGSNDVEIIEELAPELRDSMSLEFVLNRPLIDVVVNGKNARVIFDTGAHIDYIDSRYNANLKSIGRSIDFSIFGPIETDKYNSTIQVSNFESPIVIGDSTDELKMKLNYFNAVGIIGTTIFQDKTVLISYRRKKIYFE